MWTLLRRREILQLAKDNVRQHVEILDSQKERVELGAGSSADVTQTKGRLAAPRARLPMPKPRSGKVRLPTSV